MPVQVWASFVIQGNGYIFIWNFLNVQLGLFLKFYNLAGFILQSCTWEKNHFAGNLERAILIVIYIFHYLRFENNDLINI